MNTTAIGAGYVCLVTGDGLAAVGNDVLCVDVDTRKINVLKSYESAAMAETRRIYCDRPDLTPAEVPMDALDGTDVLLRATEWKAFRNANSETMQSLLKSPVVFDGRNLHDPAAMRAQGFEFFLIGQRT